MQTTAKDAKHPFDEQRDYLEEALYFLLGATIKPEPHHIAALQEFLIEDQKVLHEKTSDSTARAAAIQKNA